ncbi:hypothetical protein EJ07DRAFT_151506 [Lizonia empirigonia]|nr:hypothetical protein EJ07DRAFT_151506 [Lizonia empirigonia]
MIISPTPPRIPNHPPRRPNRLPRPLHTPPPPGPPPQRPPPSSSTAAPHRQRLRHPARFSPPSTRPSPPAGAPRLRLLTLDPARGAAAIDTANPLLMSWPDPACAARCQAETCTQCDV